MKRAVSWASGLCPVWTVLSLVVAGCGSGDDIAVQRFGELNVNLFGTLLGKSDAEVDEKVSTAVDRFFGIGSDEPN